MLEAIVLIFNVIDLIFNVLLFCDMLIGIHYLFARLTKRRYIVITFKRFCKILLVIAIFMVLMSWIDSDKFYQAGVYRNAIFSVALAFFLTFILSAAETSAVRARFLRKHKKKL